MQAHRQRSGHGPRNLGPPKFGTTVLSFEYELLVGYRGASEVRVGQGDAFSLDSPGHRGALIAGYRFRARPPTILRSVNIAESHVHAGRPASACGFTSTFRRPSARVRIGGAPTNCASNARNCTLCDRKGDICPSVDGSNFPSGRAAGVCENFRVLG